MAMLAGASRRYFDVESSESDLELSLRSEESSSSAAVAAPGRRFALPGRVLTACGLATAAAVVLVTSQRAAKAPSSAAGPSEVTTKVSLPEAVELSENSPLKPLELLHDGNVCDSNEEFFGGLCYRKCEDLTGGRAPIRTTPWSCCESSPCTFYNEHASGAPLPCRGYDVSGSGSCPHKPGACLVNEELFFGECYKSCSLLTEGAYPHRVAPATCCKATGLACLNFKNDKTSQAFAVGGGAGDNDTSTPGVVHFPIKDLTEEGKASIQKTSGIFSMPKIDDKTPDGPLKPIENMTDGNVCGDEEELWDGLCYKKCSILTEGEAAIRTSPWTCCENHPCGIKNQRGKIGSTMLCKGYDVSGSDGCPHKPGACLLDEELFLGVCYKKCEVLTEGVYPFRVGPASCCKSKNKLGCLNPMNDLTSSSLDVGGDAQDGEASAHFPELKLTEKSHDDEEEHSA